VVVIWVLSPSAGLPKTEMPKKSALTARSVSLEARLGARDLKNFLAARGLVRPGTRSHCVKTSPSSTGCESLSSPGVPSVFPPTPGFVLPCSSSKTYAGRLRE